MPTNAGKFEHTCLLAEFVIKRDEKWGGDRVYAEYEEVEKDFAEEVGTSVCCLLISRSSVRLWQITGIDSSTLNLQFVQK